MKKYLIFVCFFYMAFFVNAQNVKGRVYFWNPRSGASQQFEKQKYSNELSFEYSNFVELSNILRSIPDTFEMAAIHDYNLRKIPVELYNFCHVKGFNIIAPHINKIDSNIIGMKI